MAKQNMWIFLLTGPVSLLTGCLLVLGHDLGNQPDFSTIWGQLLSLAAAAGVFVGYIDTAVFEPGREVAIKRGGSFLVRYIIETCVTSGVLGAGLYAVVRALAG